MNAGTHPVKPRSVVGHLGVAAVSGAGGGAGIAALGSLVAVAWPGGEDPLADPMVLVGMPTVAALLGAAFGLVVGVVVGLVTLGLRHGTKPQARSDAAWGLAILVAVGGGIPLGWLWADAMGGSVLPGAGAMAFCFLVARPVAGRGLQWLLDR